MYVIKAREMIIVIKKHVIIQGIVKGNHVEKNSFNLNILNNLNGNDIHRYRMVLG